MIMNGRLDSIVPWVLLGTLVFYFAFVRRRTRVSTRSLLEDVLKEVPLKRDIPDDPVRGIIVAISGNLVSCFYPDGQTAVADFDTITGVDLVTTDEGPALPDVFWVLQEGPNEVVVPWGASNEEALRTKVCSLPGLDWDAMIAASLSTSHARFVCWRRGENLDRSKQKKPE